MSLEGMRDFSVIATAPQRRLAIKTFVAAYSSGIIREAALRELKRGGQIYFLHNDIDTIATKAEILARAAARGAHRRRPRPDGGARARARDARLLPAARQPAAVLDDHRDRHRRADRQHDHHRPRRPLRPGAAAPAARARRPLAPPGLRLPADAARRRAVRAGEEAARGDPDDGGPGLGLLSRDARPRDPRRRRSARRVAVGRDAAGRLPALHRHAEGRGDGAEVGTRARPRRSRWA